MKAVLISIRPEWCELIASGKKTVEVRKTRPKLEMPFKCYIYCTHDYKNHTTRLRKHEFWIGKPINDMSKGRYFCNGTVIGEFVCDCVKTYPADDFVGAEDLDGSIITEAKDGEFAYWIPEENETCLSYNEIRVYGNGKTLYGWHISDLKIYDEPKEVGEFSNNSSRLEFSKTKDGFPWKWSGMTKPPQSWCYVEERQNEALC